MFVSPEIEAKYKRSRVKAGDVLISLVGSMGQVAIAGPEVEGWNVARAVGLVPVIDRHHAEWVKFSLQSKGAQDFIRDHANTTVQATFNLKDLARLPIPYPPESTRVGVLAILGALDDKIEMNRKTAATLEAMARALYRSWFVDFDPVWAKLEGRAPAHMDPTTAALFPDRFTEDGLPEGWRREALGRHLNVDRGLSYKGDHLCDAGDGLPMHNLNSIYEGGGYKSEGIKFYKGDYRERHKVRPGDLIVANTEQGFDLMLMAHAALVTASFGPLGLFSQHIYKVSPKATSPLSREWLYLMLSIAPTGRELRGYANGTTVNMLPMDALEIPEAIIPPAKLVSVFTDLVSPMFAQQDALKESAKTLAALRDSLLPRLMSGELRVPEARDAIEGGA